MAELVPNYGDGNVVKQEVDCVAMPEPVGRWWAEGAAFRPAFRNAGPNADCGNYLAGPLACDWGRVGQLCHEWRRGRLARISRPEIPDQIRVEKHHFVGLGPALQVPESDAEVRNIADAGAQDLGYAAAGPPEQKYQQIIPRVGANRHHAANFAGRQILRDFPGQTRHSDPLRSTYRGQFIP